MLIRTMRVPPGFLLWVFARFARRLDVRVSPASGCAWRGVPDRWVYIARFARLLDVRAVGVCMAGKSVHPVYVVSPGLCAVWAALCSLGGSWVCIGCLLFCPAVGCASGVLYGCAL